MSSSSLIDISKLKHWCMWCKNGHIWSDNFEDVHITCDIKGTLPYVKSHSGLCASAESNDDCEHFDWDFTSPGAEWVKVVLDELDKEAIG